MAGPSGGPQGSDQVIAHLTHRTDRGDMKKRIAATILWFYAGWVVGALFAFATGLTPALAPILGTAAAAIIAGDPRHMIWARRPVSRGTAMLPSKQVLHNA